MNATTNRVCIEVCHGLLKFAARERIPVEALLFEVAYTDDDFADDNRALAKLAAAMALHATRETTPRALRDPLTLGAQVIDRARRTLAIEQRSMPTLEALERRWADRYMELFRASIA